MPKENILLKKNIVLSVCLFVFYITAYQANATMNEPKEKGAHAGRACTISEFLRHLSTVSGIKIVANREIYALIPCDADIDGDIGDIEDIVKDLLRQENYAAIWNYNKEKLSSVEIKVYEKSKGNFITMDTRDDGSSSTTGLPPQPPQPQRVGNLEQRLSSVESEVYKRPKEKFIAMNTRDNGFSGTSNIGLPPQPQKIGNLESPPLPPGAPYKR